VVDNFHLGVVADNEVERISKNIVSVVGVVADAGNADGRKLPELLIFDFSYGYAVFVLETGDDRLDDPPLVFQGLAFG